MLETKHQYHKAQTTRPPNPQKTHIWLDGLPGFEQDCPSSAEPSASPAPGPSRKTGISRRSTQRRRSSGGLPRFEAPPVIAWDRGVNRFAGQWIGRVSTIHYRHPHRRAAREKGRGARSIVDEQASGGGADPSGRTWYGHVDDRPLGSGMWGLRSRGYNPMAQGVSSAAVGWGRKGVHLRSPAAKFWRAGWVGAAAVFGPIPQPTFA